MVILAAFLLDCETDPLQLEQVIRNILENSLQAWTDHVPLALRKNGPPPTAEERLRIFDAFYTTKTQGTGLGMNIAKRIVEAHGGRIEVGPDTGVEIIITLPRGAS